MCGYRHHTRQHPCRRCGDNHRSRDCLQPQKPPVINDHSSVRDEKYPNRCGRCGNRRHTTENHTHKHNGVDCIIGIGYTKAQCKHINTPCDHIYDEVDTYFDGGTTDYKCVKCSYKYEDLVLNLRGEKVCSHTFRIISTEKIEGASDVGVSECTKCSRKFIGIDHIDHKDGMEYYSCAT